MSPAAHAGHDARPHVTDDSAGRSLGPQFEPGDQLGPYLIHRLLGSGGMGEVYEADHLEQDRRVALKILNHRLRRADDRERFLREGQLAASVNHQNCVYVFGSEEIAGLPAIAMELLPGGTLKDRVNANGPLAPVEAVDAILQIIAGLAAAESAGVLHRDVKPSNCFIDHDGTVKIGDFGLSISTVPRHVASLDGAGAFQGTPDFASPEQLRGESLDVRSDIYAVGATLFYLLTGQPPIDLRDVSNLADRVARGPVRSARTLQPAISRELDAVLHRCLSKNPDDRFESYAALTTELTPFASDAVESASMGWRAAAALCDAFVLAPLLGLVFGELVGFRTITDPTSAFLVAVIAPAFIYSVLALHLRGATVGMALFGLRITAGDGRLPSLAHSFLRTLVLFAPLLLISSLGYASNHEWMKGRVPPATAAVAFIALVSIISLSGNQSNGLAGLHDLAAGTRVTRRVAASRQEPPRIAAPPFAPPSRDRSTVRVGPYDVLDSLGPTDTGELFVAFDPRLKRRLWLHIVPNGIAALHSALRSNTRASALHWLNGTRGPFGGWDAYEAPDGVPLLSLREPTPWHLVRRWLIDLAVELEARLDLAGLSLPSLDRVWITPDGRAKLLDFCAPAPAGEPDALDASSSTAASCGRLSLSSAQRFLADIARRTLPEEPVLPLPLSASALLHSLAAVEFSAMSDVVKVLARLERATDRVTTRMRVMTLAASIAAYVIGTPLVRHYLAHLPFASAGATLLAWPLLAALSACLFRGGLWLRVFGIAVVTRDGRAASRVRATLRALVSWSWVPAQVVATASGWVILNPLVFVAKLAGLAWAADHPERGVQDRLARTFLVPR